MLQNKMYSISKALHWRLIGLMAVLVLAVLILTGCKEKEDLVKVNLNEVAHSIFYAPQYVAIEEGYFKEEGIDVNLVNGLGADKTMTALLAGEADIGFMGSEASIFIYKQGAEDYAVNFAQLTQRAGNFLVSRVGEENFTWENVKGKKVIGGRVGGRPYHDVTFETIAEIYKWTSPKVYE